MPSPTTLQQALRDSQLRLHPSLTNPNWLILRERRKIFLSGLHQLPDRISVLDIGGRLQPYRALLEARVANYVAIDLQLTPLVNIAAAAEALPFPDEHFDFVICTQVLEYCLEPHQAAFEIWRVLRKGGLAFLSVPSVFVRDNEKECWRFLPEGLRYIFKEFEAVEILPEGNSITGLFRTLNVFLVFFVRPRFLVPVLKWTIVPILNLAGLLFGKFGGTNDLFAANYSIWIRK
jgi:SAM-dependent methyltransferase